MRPEDCPKYERCNVNICPLDPQWRRRRQLKGEPVCPWLLEWAKPGAVVRMRGLLPESRLWAGIGVPYAALTAAGVPAARGLRDIRRRLSIAALQGSKHEAGNALALRYPLRRDNPRSGLPREENSP